jgi:tetratricopeptide (TPR) repeat protein
MIRFAFALSLCLLVARAAHAAPPTAKEAYQHGLQLYEADKYGEAAQAFLDAYAQKPNPMILFNVAQAYRKGGQFKLALEYYRRFLADAPPASRAPLLAETNRWVAEIEAHLALERDMLEKAEREEEARRQRRATPVLTPPQPPPQPPPPTPPPAVVEEKKEPPKPRTPAYKAWWVWTPVAVGVAAIAVGLGAGLGVKNEPSTTLGIQSAGFQ